MSNWKEMIEEAARGEKIISCTLTNEELLVEFNAGYGSHNGKEFTAWSKNYVYFPIVYDGSEWVERAPRNPCLEATRHMGGE